MLMFTQTLVLATLVGLSAAYNFEDPAADAANLQRLQRLDAKLQELGITFESSGEDVYGAFSQLQSTATNPSDQVELSLFVLMGEVGQQGQKVDCTDARLNILYDLMRALEDDPNVIDGAFFEYISDAHSQVEGTCLPQFSKRDFQGLVEKISRNYTDTVQKVLGQSFDDPSKINDADFWIKFADREREVTEKNRRSALQDVVRAAAEAKQLMKNLGYPLPYRFFKGEAKTLFVANLVVDNYKKDDSIIDNLDAKHPEVFSKVAELEVEGDVSAAISSLAKKTGVSVETVKNDIVGSCQSMGLERRTLSLAKTKYLSGMSAWAKAMASVCYDVLALPN